MFDQMKMMGALAGLMKNQDKLQEAGERIQDKLEQLRCEGEAGSGAVRVIVNGKMRVMDVALDPSLASSIAQDEQSTNMAESLIAEATNTAMKLAQEQVQDIIKREAEALGLPDLPSLGSGFGGLLGP